MQQAVQVRQAAQRQAQVAQRQAAQRLVQPRPELD